MVMTAGMACRPLLRERPGVGAARRAHDDAGDVVLAQRAQHLRLPLRILVGVGEDRREAELVERVLDADRQFGEERVGQVADDHADEVGRSGAQARGAAVIDVAERLHRPRDALARRLGDQLAARQHERNRRLGDAGVARDVDDRHSARPRAGLLTVSRLGHPSAIFWNVPIIMIDKTYAPTHRNICDVCHLRDLVIWNVTNYG